MGPQHVLCVLLCVAAASSGANGDGVNASTPHTTRQRLPLVLSRHTEVLTEPVFSGRPEEEEEEQGLGGRAERRRVCGIECQSAMPPLDPAEQESALAYETLYENATRTLTRVTLQGFSQTSSSSTWRQRNASTSSTTRGVVRTRRQVYGLDGRFVISDSRFTTRYPFSAAVRLSTGCSGVLVSPRHVLTAAHCVHDGKDYLPGARRLRVGVLQLKSRRAGGGGRGRGRGRRREGAGRGGGRGRRRNGEGRGGQEEGAPAEEDGEEEEGGGEEQNSVDGTDPARERKGGGRGRRGRGRGRSGGEASDWQTAELNRVRRAASAAATEPKKQPVFRWSRVKQTHVPRGWIQAAESAPYSNDSNSVSADYDYALLELRRRAPQRHMEVGVAPATTPLARIHFSAYDSDKGPLNGGGGGPGDGEKVVYRFCQVTKESDDLLYQRCDARQGAAGAGVYVRQRAEEEGAESTPPTAGGGGVRGGGGASDGGRGRFRRRVIGVFSGHRWVEMEGGGQRDFNVAVRITPAKYAQICHWIHGDPSLCTEM